MYTTTANQNSLHNMLNILFHLFITAILTGMLIGCGGSRMTWPDYGSNDKELVRTQPRKAPDWVNDSRIFWYDNRNEVFYIVGRSFDGGDLLLTEAEAKASAGRNLAERIQSLFSSRLSAARENERDAEVEKYSRLMLSMVTDRVPLSLATTELYFEEYKTIRGLRYNVYTLNVISENAFQFAVSEVIKRLNSEPNSEELKELLNTLERELSNGLKQ